MFKSSTTGTVVQRTFFLFIAASTLAGISAASQSLCGLDGQSPNLFILGACAYAAIIVSSWVQGRVGRTDLAVVLLPLAVAALGPHSLFDLALLAFGSGVALGAYLVDRPRRGFTSVSPSQRL